MHSHELYETNYKRSSISRSSISNPRGSIVQFENIDCDETTSFYSALDNGFTDTISSLDRLTTSGGSMWTCREFDDCEPLKEVNHFSVFWWDLSYVISPKPAIKQAVTNISDAIPFCKCSRNAGSASGDISILKNITGSFNSGQLTAIIGPSGAGKTSLLSCLSRRKSQGYSGVIKTTSSHERKLKICIIPQNDTLVGHLTVKENLIFASKLKNLNSNFNHESTIAQVGNLLGISECFQTRTSKLSGGQKRRLSIAQELVSNPDILIMDEPTSGLDSLTCYRTVCVLRDLVKLSKKCMIKPIAIIITIHQPQQEVFEVFDKIYGLAVGGISIYDGAPKDCMNFLRQHSCYSPPDTDYNPASFLIEIASGEYGCEPIERLSDNVRLDMLRSKNFPIMEPANNDSIMNSFHNQNSSINFDGNSSINAARHSGLKIDERLCKGFCSLTDGFWFRTALLIKRTFVSYRRDPSNLLIRLIFQILLPLGVVFIFGKDAGSENACPYFSSKIDINELINEEQDLSAKYQEAFKLTLENLTFVFMLSQVVISSTIGTATLLSATTTDGVLKEIHNGWYSTPSYLLSSTIVELPIEIIMPFVTMAVGYYLGGQPSSTYEWRFLTLCFGVILASLTGQSIGLIFGTLFRNNLQTGLFVAQGAILPPVVLSGFCVRTRKMSKFLQTLSLTSFYRSMNEISTISRYGFGVCGECNETKVNGGNVGMVGVPEQLRSFSRYWLSQIEDSMSQNDKNVDNTISQDDEIFDLFAQQIGLSRTNGVVVTTCKDIKPFQMFELSLKDEDLLSRIYTSIIILVVMRIAYFITFIIIGRHSSL